ncbi:amino acid hydroxylase [Streptomyces sp. PKU-MA01144]|uniref:amino acid hydroxylase n=1 Tax=Streptomyces sp. PKU-MA01144 TaxID=2729138 RepID=UPI00147D17D2|nr:amino acid hydroxylase [Streptomyces sp. PKU-MA01144]NNJ05528.1 amino acid hydroxylase [Streptomyces sp. PKU-MA01144]
MTGEYEQQKADRQQLAREWRPGEPLPAITYTEEEHALWEAVTGKLGSLHEEVACANYLRAAESVVLDRQRVPQLAEVSSVLTGLTGFHLRPAEGTVPAELFLGTFAESGFYATQYLRRPESLFHSPEPDVIHELVGHAVMLGDPVFADLYRSFGRAARRVSAPGALRDLVQVFWFALEVGVVHEGGGPRVCGAALLSSVAEMESLEQVELRPFDTADIVAQDFDDTDCMPVLFAAESVGHLVAEVQRFLTRL